MAWVFNPSLEAGAGEWPFGPPDLDSSNADPAQAGNISFFELHITNLRSNSLELNRVEFFAAASSRLLLETTSPFRRAREAEVYRIARPENAFDPFLRARPPEREFRRTPTEFQPSAQPWKSPFSE
jgi:hypothetical protein